MARNARVSWRIVAVGRPKLSFAAAGIGEYVSRLRHYAQLELIFVRGSNPVTESTELLQCTSSSFRLVLDERGDQFSSRALANRLEEWDRCRQCSLALLVGGAGGFTEEIRSSADLLWSLSRGTLQHELALLVALEQIYRGYTILQGSPYHRDR